MTRNRAFSQVDVFTATPYLGNPVAVVLDGTDLSTQQMQAFTDWTHLSEATFVLPPEDPQADYRLRIFCPGRELPFAGHPTLGSAHAWLQAGGRPKGEFIVQECGVGLVRVRRDTQAGGGCAATGTDTGHSPRLAFAAPPLRRGGPLPEEDVRLIARGLGIAREDITHHAWCDNGPNWRGVMLRSAEQVLALKPDAAVLAGLDVGVVGPRGKVGVVAPRAQAVGSTAAAPVPAELDLGDDIAHCAFEVRAFFPGHGGMAEDPVTGSLNAALAQWLIGAGLAPTQYIASQGTALGRAGRVYVQQDGPEIWIGGDSVSCITGTVML